MSRVFYVTKDIIGACINKPIARSAAALSYYLTLSVFPFLICVTVILGLLNIQDTDGFALLDGVIPDAAFSALSDYLEYIGDNRSHLMFGIGIMAMITSSSAAFRSFTGITGELQGRMRFSGALGFIISFVFSLMLLATIYVSAFVILSGEWLMHLLEVHLGVVEISLFWRWLRFVLLFMMLFIVIFSVYLISAPKNTTRMSRLPGALCASFVLVGASVGFSQLITVSMRYEILYGSLASFVILMIWLYICSLILILANVMNISIAKHKNAAEVNDSE
ncbi:MAG: YihY/virulence factor BrkB family protein [Oscillospiraceae bacterium]|nr:YihY/virulence factor BrkB family protein [Oscillospiraceae bacterium]MCL2278080.1 YihY/virulence factor BrkB family protein [Oscillospiraceae bacterium]